MNQPTLTRSLIAAGAVALFASTSAHALQIDTFSDSPSQIVASEPAGGVPDVSITASPVEIGVARSLSTNSGTGDLGTLGIAGDGLLQLSNSPTSAGRIILLYDSIPSADLTDSGASNGFLFTIEFADALIDYRFVVEGGTATGLATGVLPTGIIESGDAQDFFVPFSDFATISGTGVVDFSAVELLTVSFTPSSDVLGADLSISNLRTGVPEPSSLALLALGGLAMMRRRGA